ncbi:MAG: hypothetical protein ACLTSZ_12400 [Lachnospiraceae bacterium]
MIGAASLCWKQPRIVEAYEDDEYLIMITMTIMMIMITRMTTDMMIVAGI